MSKRIITGEATPTYFIDPDVPARVNRIPPDVKLILALRDPVKRALSHYQHNIRTGRETLSLRDALEAESGRLEASFTRNAALSTSRDIDWLLFGYKRSGNYAAHLRCWLEHFDRSQMHIIQAERFWADSQVVMNELQAFLELPRYEYPDFQVRNQARTKADIPDDVIENLRSYFAPLNEQLYELLGARYSW